MLGEDYKEWSWVVLEMVSHHRRQGKFKFALEEFKGISGLFGELLRVSWANHDSKNLTHILTHATCYYHSSPKKKTIKTVYH